MNKTLKLIKCLLNLNATYTLEFPGIKKLRFKPAYNPYTEPSMEIFSYHEGNITKCKALTGLEGLILLY